MGPRVFHAKFQLNISKNVETGQKCCPICQGIHPLLHFEEFSNNVPEEVNIRIFFSLNLWLFIVSIKVDKDMIIKCLASKNWAWDRLLYLKTNKSKVVKWWIPPSESLHNRKSLPSEIGQVDVLWADSKHNYFWRGAHQTYICLAQDKCWIDMTYVTIQKIFQCGSHHWTKWTSHPNAN